MLTSQEDDCVRSTKCSSASVFVAMDRFIQSANNLESTVLIPSRLKDMTMPEPQKTTPTIQQNHYKNQLTQSSQMVGIGSHNYHYNTNSNHHPSTGTTQNFNPRRCVRLRNSLSLSSSSSSSPPLSPAHQVYSASPVQLFSNCPSSIDGNSLPTILSSPQYCYSQSISCSSSSSSTASTTSSISTIGSIGSTSTSASASSPTTCPHELYHILKDVKKELLWGTSSSNLELLAYQKPLVQHSQSSSYASPPALYSPPTISPLSSSSQQHQQTTVALPTSGVQNQSPYCSVSSSPSSSSSSSSHVLMLRDVDRIDHRDRDRDSTTSSTTSDSTSTSSVSANTDDDQASSMLLTMFRYHLHSLHTILHQLADSADQLSCKYVEEIENSTR